MEGFDILSQLIPNPLTMIAQLCCTFILFMLVRKFLWKSIKAYFAARSEKMHADMLESQQAKEAALEDRKQASLELQNAASKRQEIMDSAIKEAKQEKETILLEANQQAEAVRRKAEEQIVLEKQRMQESIKEEIVNVALLAAGKLLGDQNADTIDQNAISTLIKEVEK